MTSRFTMRRLLPWAIWLLAGSLACVLGFRSIFLQNGATCAAVSSVPPSGSSQLIGATKAEAATDSLDEALVKAMACSSPSERQEKLIALLAELATSDPDLALRFALSESNPALQRSLLSAALRGWATVNPEAAEAWTLQRPHAEHVADFMAVIDGIERDPALAVEVATLAVRDDPEFAHDYGNYLINVLARTGDFSTALEFARNGPNEQRLPWVLATLSQWADQQPHEAADAALALTDRGLREGMISEVLERWSRADPAAAVAYASSLEGAEDRQFAFTTTLGKWVRQDPVQAAAWIGQYQHAEEIDEGVANLAMSIPLLASRPIDAVEWAASIHEPVLRARTLAFVVYEWAQRDSNAVTAYMAGTHLLSAPERQLFLTLLRPSN